MNEKILPDDIESKSLSELTDIADHLIQELESKKNLEESIDDYQYLINTGWVSLVNPASMTSEDGTANVMFAAWEEFVGHTVTVYCGYTDDCGVHHVDSLKIEIIDNE